MTLYALHIDVIGRAWGGFEGTYSKVLSLDAPPSSVTIEEMRSDLLTGSARAKLASGEEVDFGDFQYLTDARVTLVTTERNGTREVIDTDVVADWVDPKSADKFEPEVEFDEPEVDEAQEWHDYDPDC